MPRITEVAADVFQICTFVPEANLQFHQFVVRDDQPLLFHTGMRALFPEVIGAVARLLDPGTIRWIGFSHFEADECGALPLWLGAAPQAEAVCSFVAKVVSVDDFAPRPARALADGEVLITGRHRLRFLQTPRVPHCWEAGLLFDETTGTLLCSDLFSHGDDVEPLTHEDIVGRFQEMLAGYQQGPLAHYLPYTPHTQPTLDRLAELAPSTLATMHGSSFQGNGAQALQDLGRALREVLGSGKV